MVLQKSSQDKALDTLVIKKKMVSKLYIPNAYEPMANYFSTCLSIFWVIRKRGGVGGRGRGERKSQA